MAQVHGTSAVHASNPPATQQEPTPPRQQPTATRQQHAEPPQDPARPTARPRRPSRSSRPERGTVYICRWLWRARADAGCLACAVQRVTGALPPPPPPLSHRRRPSHHQCHPLEYGQYLAPARRTPGARSTVDLRQPSLPSRAPTALSLHASPMLVHSNTNVACRVHAMGGTHLPALPAPIRLTAPYYTSRTMYAYPLAMYIPLSSVKAVKGS